MKHIIALAGVVLMAFHSGSAFGQFQNMNMTGDSISARVNARWIKVTAIGDNIVRVQASATANPFQTSSFSVLSGLPPGASNGGITNAGLGLTLPLFSARLNGRGEVSFADSNGKPILAEGPRTFDPTEVQGENTFHLRQQWLSDPDEALYGLGQHQFGFVNIKGYDIDLWQRNTEIAIPFLVSSKGYGILWDNPSFTKFGDPRDFSPIPPDHIFDNDSKPGGFTATPFSGSNWGSWTIGQPGVQRIDPAINVAGGAGARGRGGRGRGNQESALRWEGQVLADTAGSYQFRLYADGGYRMWIDDQLVADHWRQGWLPGDELARIRFEANTRHKIKVEWIKDGGMHCTLTWKPPDPATAAVDNTSLWSQVGQGIDYYFIYGGSGGGGTGAIDKVIAGYRRLTGKAPMMPIWAFGLWQCRQRYMTQQESLDVIKGFRDRKIPLDNIVQDWMYWREDDWGSHNFDPQRFPDPDQWIKDIHAQHARLMISVWPKFYPTTDNYKVLADKGYMFPVYPARDWVGRGYQYAFYDAYSPEARDMFWQQMNTRLFSKGVDAWWMDATEPEFVQPAPTTFERQLAGMTKTSLGTGASVLNAYPLMNSQAVYEGQRKAAPDQRVFILTRSGYAGQQRYAAASWSGDISATWTAMKKQIAAGLGFSISGLPYWTMDSGGFAVPSIFNSRNASVEALDEWREMNTRWFQFAAFSPLLRVHGEFPNREMWEFGGNDSLAYRAQLNADRLRYRLLPYIYSLAGDVTQRDATLMRPLVIDFPNDKTARDINDQFMFGPALLVSPVTSYKARSREVCLPLAPGSAGGSPAGWYNFWSGRPVSALIYLDGGILHIPPITAPAPYDQIPLHVRAGSIIPMGPDLQYTTEKKVDPLTLYVYTGANGQFSLYEDDGLTYAYEKGAFARIPISWNESTKTLTLGKREGSFPGMLADRTINIIFITPDKAVPFSFDATPDKTVKYSGNPIDIKP